MTFPLWPTWRSWSLEDRPMIDALLTQLDAPYSDVSFSSCYAWDVGGEAAWTTINGNLILRMPDYATRESIYVLAGMKDPAGAAIALLDGGHCTELKLVPECVADLCRSEPRLAVLASPENDDYVYDVSRHQSLEGAPYKSQRAQRNRFRRAYPDYQVIRDCGAAIGMPAVRDSLLALFDDWACTSNPTEDPTTERRALARLLDAAEHFELSLVRIVVDDRLIAFSLDEVLPNGWALGCFMKADRAVREPYVEVTVQSAAGFAARGVHLLNNEQDLGLPGLRESKRRWQPVRMLHKYSIRLASDEAEGGSR